MKRVLLALLVLAMSCVGNKVRADIVFDTLTGLVTVTTSTSNPGNRFADGATALAPLSAGQHWALNRVDFAFFVLGAQSFAAGQLGFEIQLFDSFNPLTTGTTNVMGNLQGTIAGTFGALTTTGNAAFTTGVGFAPINLLTNQASLGYIVRFTNAGAPTGVVRAGLRNDLPASVGVTPNGFYRDNDDNGIITGSDWRSIGGATLGNIIIRFQGDAVPEPATAGLALIAAVGGLFYRRRS